MIKTTPKLSLTACTLAAALFLSACGGGVVPDTTPPTATITSVASGSTVTFTFTFSEDVGASFTADDVTVTGGTKAATVTKTDATHYTLAVTPDATATSVVATVAAGKFTDVALNANTASATNTYTVPSNAPTTAPTTPPTRTATDVLSVYGEAYTQIADVKTRPDWGQSTTVTEQTIAGNKVLKYGTLNYEGTEFTAINVSSMTKLHMDVWTPDITSFKVSVISAGKENAVTLTATPSSWNSYDIDMAQYTAADKTAVIQLKIEAAAPTSGTLYLDNIYFYKTSTPAASCTAGAACTIDFSSSTTMGGAGFEGLVSSAIAADPVVSTNQALQMVKKPSSAATPPTGFSQPWAGVNLYAATPASATTGPFLVGSIDFSTSKVIAARVYSPAAGIPMLLKVTSAGGASAQVSASTTAANAWETLSFDFTGKQDSTVTYNQMAFFPDYDGTKATRLDVSSTYYLDDVKFTVASGSSGGTVVDRGAGGLQTLASGVWASDYQGDLAVANSAKTTLGGYVGFSVDPRLLVNKKYDFGGISSAITDAAGTHNFYYGLGVTTVAYTDSYFSAYVNAPANGYVDVSGYSNLKMTIWGPSQQFEKTFTPNLKIVLTGPLVSTCTSNTKGSEVEAALIPALKIGAASQYTIALSSLTLKQACSGETTVAEVLKKLAGITIQLNGTNLQWSVEDTNNPGAYPNGLNVGPISFN